MDDNISPVFGTPPGSPSPTFGPTDNNSIMDYSRVTTTESSTINCFDGSSMEIEERDDEMERNDTMTDDDNIIEERSLLGVRGDIFSSCIPADVNQSDLINQNVQSLYWSCLLNNSGNNDEDNITLFDCRIKMADFLNDPTSAFGLYRMNLNLLFDDEYADSIKLTSLETNVTTFHNFVIESLHKTELNRSTVELEDRAMFVEILIKEIKGLLLDIGSMCSLLDKSLVVSQLLEKKSVLYWRLHFLLRLWFMTMECALFVEHHNLSSNFSPFVVGICDNFQYDSFIAQLIILFINDLTVVASILAQQSNTAVPLRTVFPCSCFQKLWCLIYQVSTNHLKRSIWTLLGWNFAFLFDSDVLKEPPFYLSDVFYVPFKERYPDINMTMFLWDFFRWLSCLLPNDDLAGPDLVLDKLMNHSLNLSSHRVTTEKQLRHLLICVYEIFSKFPSNKTSIVIDLWDFYSSRLQRPTAFVGDSIENQLNQGTLSLSQSLNDWNNIIFSYVDQNSQVDKSCWTSWQHFLRLTALFCRRMFVFLIYLPKKVSLVFIDDGSWEQLKSRIYTKIKPTTVRDCGALGLSNILSLFLVFAHVKDPEGSASYLWKQLVPKMRLSLATVDGVKKYRFICRSTALIMKFYQKHQLDCTELSKYIVSVYENAVESLNSTNRANLSVEQELYKFINEYFSVIIKGLYCDGSPWCKGSQCLLDISIEKLLNDCAAISCQQVIIEVLQLLFETTRNLLINGHNIIATLEVIAPVLVALKQKMIPALYKNWSQMVSRGCSVFDALTQMFLMMMIPSTCSPFTYKEISDKFHEILLRLKSDTTSQFDHSIIISFLYNCLSGSEQLFLGLDCQTQVLVVNAWLRAIIKGVHVNDQVLWLTNRLRRFSSLTTVVADADTLQEVNDPYEFCWRLFELIGKNTSNVAARINFIHFMNSWFAKIVDFVVQYKCKQNRPNEAAKAYKLTGRMVRYCSPLIYKSGDSSCILAKIISQLVICKEVRSKVTKDLRYCNFVGRHLLEDVMEGILSLNWTNERYLERNLAELFELFIPILCTNNKHMLGPSAITNNLLYRVIISGNPSAPEERIIPLRKVMLKGIEQGLPNGSSTDINSYISFYKQVLEKTHSRTVVEADKKPVIQVFLAHCLKTKDQDIQNECLALIETILDKLNEFGDTDWNFFFEILDTLVSKSPNPMVSYGIVRKLKISKPYLSDRLDEFVQNSVAKVEQRSGHGTNSLLRSQLNTYLNEER